MAYSVIASTAKDSTNGTDVTTDAIDTTGADLIVIGITNFVLAATGTISGSKGNSYTTLTPQESPSPRATLFYKQAPTVGAGHTFSISTVTDSFPSLFVIALSGSVASPFDLENGATGGAITTLKPGLITPTENNEIVIALLAYVSNVESSIDESYIESNDLASTGTAIGGTMAYKIQTTAAATDPEFTVASAANLAAVIASFKVDSGAVVPNLRVVTTGLSWR